jgi:CubicO group peptidase (beta-lactamase class C family)
MKIRFVSVLILLLVVQIGVAQQTPPEPDFDQYVEKAMKEWEVPGLAIAVVKDDRMVFAKGYGVRELGGTAAVNERTLFAIGSSSKAFTAATIAMDFRLNARGQLESVMIEGLGEFTRVPDKPAPGPISSN